MHEMSMHTESEEPTISQQFQLFATSRFYQLFDKLSVLREKYL